MADPLAQRVASRYLRALEHHDTDALVQKLEATVHRGEVMLQVAVQQHTFWASAIGEGKPFHDIEKLYRKIGGFLSGYQHEINTAMATLEEIEHLEAREGFEGY